MEGAEYPAAPRTARGARDGPSRWGRYFFGYYHRSAPSPLIDLGELATPFSSSSSGAENCLVGWLRGLSHAGACSPWWHLVGMGEVWPGGMPWWPVRWSLTGWGS